MAYRNDNQKVEGGKMMNKIINNKYAKLGAMLGLIICLAISMMAIGSAEYLSQKQNTAFTLTITSNNATACNLSTIQYPDGTQTLFNLALTKNGQTFYKDIASGNYSQLGTTCHYISCTDGVTAETGSVCRDISPSGNSGGSNLAFFFLIIAVIYAIALIGFFGRNEWIAILGGLGLIALGIYTVNNGVVIYKDFITNVFSWTTIGVGAFIAIFTAVSLIQE